MKKDKKNKKPKLNLILTILVLLVIGLGICLLQLVISVPGFSQSLAEFKLQPKLFILNGLPVFALLFLLWFLLGNGFYAGSITSFIFLAISYANMLKIEGRDDPLVPSDVSLLREAIDATTEYNLDMHWDLAAIAIAVIIGLLVLGIFIKTKKLKRFISLPLAAVTILCFLYVFNNKYQSKDLYNSFEVETPYNITCVFNTLGVNYCFLYNYNLYPVDTPSGFSKTEAADWDENGLDGKAKESTASASGMPNVIFVMAEAFSDLSEEDIFNYTEETSPMKDYYTVANSGRAISGHIVVPNFAAGTANTEFDVLTGMMTTAIGESVTSSFRTVRSTTRSLPSVLKSIGYNTYYMHPGQSWFYNRSSVYKFLGIDDQVFADTYSDFFDESTKKGQMISDEAFLERLITDLDEKLAEDEPVFAMSVTIENHQTYNYWKFPSNLQYDAVETDVALSSEATENLQVYFEGVKDTSSMLLELTEYINSVKEPTILVFFGDHRPSMQTAYDELGLSFDSDSYEKYETPFLIYGNTAYTNTYGALNASKYFSYLEEDEEILINANYLGAVTYEILGLGENEDPFFAFLNDLRLTVPVFRAEEHNMDSGSFAILRKWSYYRLKY